MMYRVVTGACQYGVSRFLEDNKVEEKDYTINEILEMTKGQYGYKTISDFFK